MIFSRTVEYAIRAIAFLASQPPGKLAGAREISAAEGIPMPFLWKVLQKLARNKLVRSFKGTRGGYQLARPGDSITLDAILAAVEAESLEGKCVLGLKSCDDNSPCPLHDQWREIRAQVVSMLECTTAADLARAARATPPAIDLPVATLTIPKAAPKGTR